MLDIYKKWIIFAVILIIVSLIPVHKIYELEFTMHKLLFMIPAFIWMDEALSKYKPSLSAIFSFIIIAGSILGLIISYFTNDYSATLNHPVKITIIIMHILLIIWSLIYIIFQKLSPLSTIPQSYNILLYSLGVIYILIKHHENFNYFINFLGILVIINSILIAFYYIFNLHLTYHRLLTVPFYLVLLGLIYLIYIYDVSPEMVNKCYYKLLIYTFIIYLLAFIIMVFVAKNPITEELNSYQILTLLCTFSYLLSLFFNILNKHDCLNDINYNIFTILNDPKIYCIIVIYLFRILEIHQPLLRGLLILLVSIIVTTQLFLFFLEICYHYKFAISENQSASTLKWIAELLFMILLVTPKIIILLLLLLIIAIAYRTFHSRPNHLS